MLFGFVAGTVSIIKRALVTAPAQPVAWVAAIALVVFAIVAAIAVFTLITVVLSRLGELAPKSRVYFGHITKQYGKDYAKYVGEIMKLTDQEWAEEIGTQIVEVSHIALTKHQLIRRAALLTIIAFGCWLVALSSSSFIP